MTAERRGPTLHETTCASEVKVIRVVEIVGDGQSREAPVRQVISYWTQGGELIARQDPIAAKYSGPHPSSIQD